MKIRARQQLMHQGEGIMLMNMTPHNVVIDMGDSTLTVEPVGGIARVSSTTKQVGEISVEGVSIPLNKIEFGDVEVNIPFMEGNKFPSPKDGMFFIVSSLVKARLEKVGRVDDILSPDTGKANRNEQGQIISVPAFCVELG